MSDDEVPLLRVLAETERKRQEHYPAAWEDVLAGRRPAREVAEERAAVDPPEEHAALLAMFRGPLSDAALDGLVTRALAAQAPVSEAGASPPTNVVPLRRRRWVVFSTMAAALASAAVVLLLVVPSAPRQELPAFGIVIQDSSVQESRSTAKMPAVRRYLSGSMLDWRISPEQVVTQAIELRVLAHASDGRVRVLAPNVTSSPEGVFRLRGPIEEHLPLEPGRWRLQVLVSPTDAAPADAAAAVEGLRSGAVRAAGELELEILGGG